ncbi:MAG: UDP-N-acetylglucosamine 2-epimerase [Nanoarchaeota archaeon]|nr:UDP-N-acetylglucosamine 2-epimerase [Nanoarchaeota archaeon]
MYKGKKILAVILARGGSKRLPGKNIKNLGRVPLIGHTIQAAVRSALIDKIVVSSDSDEILKVSSRFPCVVQKRPAHLAEDATTSQDSLRYVVTEFEKEQQEKYDLVVLLQPTCPFRKTAEIEKCIKKLVDNDADSSQTVALVKEKPELMFVEEGEKLVFQNKTAFFNKSLRRTHYILNGAAYVVRKEVFLSTGNLYGEKNIPVIMSQDDSLDIDTYADWQVAEKILEERKRLEQGKQNHISRKPITIAGKQLGDEHPTFIIAEIGVNHNGDMDLAHKLIDLAVEAGADAVKFQNFNPQTGTSKFTPKVTYQKENDGPEGNYQTMLERLKITEDQTKMLAEYAAKKGTIFLSTASDAESLEVLKKVDPPAYKIGSPHITNLPLLKDTAKCGKPMIISTGMATYEEIDEAIQVCQEVGNEQIILLHAVSDYPTQFQDANLNVIARLRERYPTLHIGYSDHTMGIEASTVAVALGARILERHFTLDKTLPGPDHKASLVFGELEALVRAVRNIEMALGDGVKRRTLREDEVARTARRSVVAHVDIPAGTVLTAEMVRMKKPETGIKPKYYWSLLGKRIIRDIEADRSLQWEDIEGGMEKKPKRKIAVVTVSRAEYGILTKLLKKIQANPDLELQLLVTGSHVMKGMGDTIQDIIDDGFSIAAKIDMELASDSPQEIAKAMGTIVQKMSSALAELQPDLLVLISDRFETLAAAVAASPFTIPVVHIAGGVVTEGAIDDKMRHATTKISHLHFPVDERGAQNLRLMGEEEWRIKLSGSMAIDLLKSEAVFSREELASHLGIDFSKGVILFVYHPVTLEYQDTARQIQNALEAVLSFGMQVIALYPNQDTSRSIIVEALERAAAEHPNLKLVHHLKRGRYASLLDHCSVMVGNSSSGLLEAPTFQTPVVNIGNRQKGRGRTGNVIDCGYAVAEIKAAIEKALHDPGFRLQLAEVQNPFGKGNAADIIYDTIIHLDLKNKALLEKKIRD